jgi:hypothetical protein
MAEKSKSKTPVVCTLCDKPIATGKPVIIDDDPYHADCAKAMEQSSGAAEETDEEEDAEEEDEDTDGEDEGDEDEEDDEEEEVVVKPTAKKAPAKAPTKPTAKRVVVEDEDDEDEEDDEDDEDDDEEEEEVVVRPAAKKATAAPAKKAAPVKAKAPVVEDDEDDEDEVPDEEEEEVVVVRPAKKAAVAKATAKTTTKRAAADYEEEDEPEARPTKAKANGAVKKAAVPKVDTSGWGNPSTIGAKRYFVYQALKLVSKAELADSDGAGKPENVITEAKRLHRAWAKSTKTTLSEKDQNYTSMNIGWIYNHADDLGLVMRHNEEAGTYRIWKAKDADAD